MYARVTICIALSFVFFGILPLCLFAFAYAYGRAPFSFHFRCVLHKLTSPRFALELALVFVLVHVRFGLVRFNSFGVVQY